MLPFIRITGARTLGPKEWARVLLSSVHYEEYYHVLMGDSDPKLSRKKGSGVRKGKFSSPINSLNIEQVPLPDSNLVEGYS